MVILLRVDLMIYCHQTSAIIIGVEDLMHQMYIMVNSCHKLTIGRFIDSVDIHGYL